MSLSELVAALLLVSVLALASRWIFRPSTPRLGPRPLVGDRGLLRPVAEVEDQATAERVRGMLAAAGIRCTAGPTSGGRVEILVFPADLEQARVLLGLD